MDNKAAEYRRLAQDARATANQISLWDVREKLLSKPGSGRPGPRLPSATGRKRRTRARSSGSQGASAHLNVSLTATLRTPHVAQATGSATC